MLTGNFWLHPLPHVTKLPPLAWQQLLLMICSRSCRYVKLFAAFTCTEYDIIYGNGIECNLNHNWIWFCIRFSFYNLWGPNNTVSWKLLNCLPVTSCNSSVTWWWWWCILEARLQALSGRNYIKGSTRNTISINVGLTQQKCLKEFSDNENFLEL